MQTISMFNWNGTVVEDAKTDEQVFKITLRHLPEAACMGFEVFEISGPQKCIKQFLAHYALELDPAA